MSDKNSRISPLLKQIWSVLAVLLCMLAQGMAQGFTSVLLTALKKPDSPIQVDIHLASWLASAFPMSVVIGFLTATIFMEIFGRKIAFILEVIPGVTAMVLIYFGTNFGTLMAARFIDGLTAGGAVSIAAVIIGEYVSPDYRGMFLNMKSACICLGNTIVHSLGFFLHWKTVALIVLAPYAVALAIVCTWTESPSWLAYNKRFKECEEVFLWLRGDSDASRAELDNLIKAQEERAQQLRSNSIAEVKRFLVKLKRKDFLHPVFLLVCCAMLMESTGRHLVPAYATDIVGGIVGNHGQSFYYTLALDLIITISATFSSILIKLMKTRTLLFYSGISSLIVLATGCLYIFLASVDVISQDKPYIPLLMYLSYFVLVNLGCTPISLSLLGEILPMEHKSHGVFVFGLANCIFMIITLKVFPYMMLYLQLYGTFAVLGGITGILLIVLYYALPETKNRTLQDIEDCLKYGKVLNRGRRNVESKKLLNSNI